MPKTAYALNDIHAKRLLTYDFSIYDYKINLITDVPVLVNYIKNHYINTPTVKNPKNITITLLRGKETYKTLRQDILASGGKIQNNDHYESLFNLKNRSWVGLVYRNQQTIGYYALFQNTLKTLLKIDGFAFLHASCWAKDRHCVIATGPSGYGKTTLLISAAVNGFKIISDSHTMIGKKGRNTISVTFPYIEGLSRRNNRKDTLNLLNAGSWESYRVPSLLIFLEKATGWNLRWQAISKPEAAIKLLTSSVNTFNMEIVNNRAVKNMFNRLNSLALQVKSGILTIGCENIKKELLKRGSLWKDLQKII
ncbi:MAG: hypothetical protein PHV77_04775 [Candidatus Omnitrophica bacterium]|nr:hypothetical protein [Candidatus Omnitrophota bacterium]